MHRPSSSISSAAGPDALAGGHSESVILEVCRGRTAHPLRPVHSERFLIGSSPRCDLRLGGDDMPPLHSLIVIDGTDVWLEAVAPRPHLVVNDRPQSSVRLVDGDLIRIGHFEFVAHVALPVAEAAAPDDEVDAEAADELAPSDLSAAELVERIEAATELVDEFERRQRLGMESLLNTIEQREPSNGDGPAEALLPMSGLSDETRVLSELEAVVGQLGGVVAELENRTGRQSRREAGYLDAVSTLFDSQERLSRQLDSLLRRVASLNDGQSDREPGRAIA